MVSGFRCQAQIEYGGATYVGVFDRPDPSSAVLTLSEPVAMSGLVMRWDGSSVHVQYLGMELSVNEAELPVGAVIRVLCDTLDACVQGEREPSASRIEGDSACGRFTVTLDDKSGRPCRMDIPAIDFSVTFSAWETSDGS